MAHLSALLCLAGPVLWGGCVSGTVTTISLVEFDPIENVTAAQSPPLPLILAVRPPTGDYAKKYNQISAYSKSSEVANYRADWRRQAQAQFPTVLARFLAQRRIFDNVIMVSADAEGRGPADLTLECKLTEYQTTDVATYDVSLLTDTSWTAGVTSSIRAEFTLRSGSNDTWEFVAGKTWPTKTFHGAHADNQRQEKDYNRQVMTEFLEDVAGKIETVRPKLALLEGRTRIAGPARVGDRTSAGPVADRWAVAIGVSEYRHANKNLPSLKYAHRDAEQFATFLKSEAGGGFAADHVKVLTDRQATAKQIRDGLFTFLKKTVKEDLVIIFFSGHGIPDPDKPSNLYLVAHDSDPANISATGIPMWDIETALKRTIAAERVIVLADTCHSAGVTEGVKGVKIGTEFNKYFAALANARPGRVIFTSCEGYEVSREGKKWGGGHGVFTWAMLQGLKGNADQDKNGIVTLGEMLDYVDITVRRETANEQHPTKAGVRFDRNLPMGVVK